jgi:hypothetical protein
LFDTTACRTIHETGESLIRVLSFLDPENALGASPLRRPAVAVANTTSDSSLSRQSVA